MRTAEEYLDRNGFDLKAFEYENEYSAKNLISAINEARKEAIEECAKRAKSEWVRFGTHYGHQVEEQSILSLINELK